LQLTHATDEVCWQYRDPVVSDNECKPKLGQLLNAAVPQNGDSRIQIREILDSFGNRSYGPALFFFSLIELLPFVSVIPGMYIVTASILIILSAQMLVGRERPWLPSWILNRSLSREKLQAALCRWRHWIAWLEKLIHPRLEFLVAPPFLQVIALTCILLAVSFFPLSPIPASEKVPALPVAFFALAITARDGVFALFGFAITASSIGLLIYFWPTVARAALQVLEIAGF
jgi:hypothetical protein